MNLTPFVKSKTEQQKKTPRKARAKGSHLNKRLSLEWLERRDLLAHLALTWSGGAPNGDTTWNNPLNWDGVHKPGQFSNNPLGYYDDITLQGNSQSINNIYGLSIYSLRGNSDYTILNNSVPFTVTGSLSSSGHSATINSDIILSGDVSIDSMSINGNISGYGGSLTKTGSGRLTLSGTNTYTGTTTVNGGILEATTKTSLPSGCFAASPNNKAVVQSGGNLLIDIGGSNSYTADDFSTLLSNASFDSGSFIGIGSTQSLTLTYPAPGSQQVQITGEKGLYIAPSVNLTLVGVNNYNGNYNDGTATYGTYIVGSLTVADSTNFGTGGLKMAGPLHITGTGNISLDRTIYLNGSSVGTLDIADSGAVVSDSSNITGYGSLSKTGTGKLVLSGTNTYSGVSSVTKVQGGCLQVAMPGSLSGYNVAGKINVFASATLEVNAGGSSEWQASDIQTLISNTTSITFPTGSFLALDTTHANNGNFPFGNISGAFRL